MSRPSKSGKYVSVCMHAGLYPRWIRQPSKHHRRRKQSVCLRILTQQAALTHHDQRQLNGCAGCVENCISFMICKCWMQHITKSHVFRPLHDAHLHLNLCVRLLSRNVRALRSHIKHIVESSERRATCSATPSKTSTCILRRKLLFKSPGVVATLLRFFPNCRMLSFKK